MPDAKIILNEGDPDDEVSIPARWDVCPSCQGRKHVPLQGIAFTQSEMDEDPDFREDYFSGHYDRSCTECNGEGLVAVPDELRATPDQLNAWSDHQADEADDRAMAEAERRAGC